MFNPFQIYRNHKRFLRLQERAIVFISDNDKGADIAKGNMLRGQDVDINEIRFSRYLHSTLGIFYIFDLASILGDSIVSRSDFHKRCVEKIKDL